MNPVIKKLISIPAGVYSIGLNHAAIEAVSRELAGSTLKKEFLLSSCPRHEVSLDGFSVGGEPVTGNEFAFFIEDTGYVTGAEKDGWGWVWDGSWRKRDGASWRTPHGRDANDREQGSLPVMQVSWHDAAEYCRWLSLRTGSPVRLPREAEWEVFAELIGAGRVGSEEAPVRADYLESLGARFREGGFCGIGLLWEWTEDWYERYPGGPDNRDFGTVYRVLRGGSLMSHPVQRMREFRLRKCPTARSPYYGFRIARSDISN